MQYLLLFLAALASVAFCKELIPPAAPLLRTRHILRQHFMNSGGGDDVSSKYPWLARSFFKQKLDHFDPINVKTWNQRYYYNSKYARNNSIVFLMIGGEGPEDGTWAADPGVQYLQMAKEFGAHVFDLEHRFFGESWPFPDMDVKSLTLLTTEQALADLAYFIISMNQLYGFSNPRWITFGGSYPGYADVVQDDLTITNKTCPVHVRTAFEIMQNFSTTALGRDQLNRYFNLDPPFSSTTNQTDITNFFANVYSVFQSMAQYTYDGRNGETHYNLTVRKLCEIMMDPKEENVVKRVYNLFLWYNAITGDLSKNLTVFPNSYTDMITSVKSGNLTVLGDNAATRGWLYLCCNELGLMQTTDQADNIFGYTVPLSFFIQMCADVFDETFTNGSISSRNLATQNYYGGVLHYNATNIVLPNGSMDPWHALGSDVNNTASMFPILINGTAHCSDMYPSYDGEPAVLADVRQQIKEHVKTFIRYNPATDGPGKGTFSVSPLISIVILLLSLNLS